MCTGHTHALAGAVTGTAASLYVLHLPPAQTALAALATAGAAVLPDIDHPDATLAHCFGFLTKGFAWLVGRVSGGHRHGTHSVAGVAVFTGLAWLAVHFRAAPAGRAGLAILLSLVFAGALYALRLGGHWADLLAIGGGVAMTWTGYGLGLVVAATGLGCAVHVATDMLTDSGCPLAWPLGGPRIARRLPAKAARAYRVLGRRVRWVPEPIAFTTGTKPEGVLALVLGAILCYLAFREVSLVHLAALHVARG